MEWGKSDANLVKKHDGSPIVSSLKNDVHDIDYQLQKQRQKHKSATLQSQLLQRREEPPNPLLAPPTNAALTQYRRERMQRSVNNNSQLGNMKILLTDTNMQSMEDIGQIEKSIIMNLKPTLPLASSSKSVDQLAPYAIDAATRNEQTRLNEWDIVPLESLHSPSLSPKRQQQENHHVLVQRNLLAIQSNLEKLSFPSEVDLAKFSEARQQHFRWNLVNEGSTSDDGTGRVATHSEQRDLPVSTSLVENTLKKKGVSEDLHDFSGMANSNMNWLVHRLFEIKMFVYGVAAGISFASFAESFLNRTVEEFVREVPRLAKESRRLFYITTSISIFISSIFSYLCNASQKARGETIDNNHCPYTASCGAVKSHSIHLPKQITVVACGCCYLMGLILSLVCEVPGRHLLAIKHPNDQQEQYEAIIALWKALNTARCLFCAVPWFVECFAHVSHIA
jgi:hypothetical protein